MEPHKANEANDEKVSLANSLLKAFNYDLSEATKALSRQSDALKAADSQRSKKNIEEYERAGLEPLIEIKGLTKEYKNGKSKLTAVSNADLKIYPGEFVAITGASGSGKSTLMHLMGALDKPTSGTIVINGQDISKLTDKNLSNFRNKTIGFVFQFFYMQPFLNLSQNISVPSMVNNLSPKKRKARIEELASAVGLSDRLTHLPKELSGGQMQRAAIARALFNAPKIILADEPTGNLDSVNSSSVIKLFQEIRDKFGTTIITVTHDASIARQADRKIIMKDGAIL